VVDEKNMQLLNEGQEAYYTWEQAAALDPEALAAALAPGKLADRQLAAMLRQPGVSAGQTGG
jgi:hypothetical protein